MTSRLSPAPAIFVALLMLPIYWLIIMSVKTNGEIGAGITFYPHAPTLENFRLIFGDASWYYGYVNA
ncbi:MAG: hypothetical protein ABL936_19210, partial [Aestuariivirga sp.]